MFKKILPLSHIEDIEKKVKNTVLNLENKFFSIFKIQVENIINEKNGNGEKFEMTEKRRLKIDWMLFFQDIIQMILYWDMKS